MTTLKELLEELEDPDVKYALGEAERTAIREAVKDAERYRFLRQPGSPIELHDLATKYGEELDAAIDDAIKRADPA